MISPTMVNAVLRHAMALSANKVRQMLVYPIQSFLYPLNIQYYEFLYNIYASIRPFDLGRFFIYKCMEE